MDDAEKRSLADRSTNDASEMLCVTLCKTAGAVKGVDPESNCLFLDLVLIAGLYRFKTPLNVRGILKI